VLAREIGRKPRHQGFCLVGIGSEDRDDVLHRHSVMVGMPAIEVGHHRDRGVAELGLARELRLRQVGHADHGIAEPLVGHALGVARELRAFHADVGAAAHELDASSRRRRPHWAAISKSRPLLKGATSEAATTKDGLEFETRHTIVPQEKDRGIRGLIA